MLGSLNTDIVAHGVDDIIGPGEYAYGDELSIGPGGKSRNMAQMAAHLTGPGTVAMVGRTVRDEYGLWEQPIQALDEAGVNTAFITVLDADETDELPGIALIAVDEEGNNQIYVVEGVSAEFCPQDIDDALPLFAAAERNSGLLGLSLELPLDTARHAVKRAAEHDLRVVFDPGGMTDEEDYGPLLEEDIFLIKPNEHEARELTGVDVTDHGSARAAAAELQEYGIENVLITVGADGAYLFTGDRGEHIPAPDIGSAAVTDETGCGDQVMAALCAGLADGAPVQEAAEQAVAAATLQFHRPGIDPVEEAALAEHTDDS